MTRITGAVGAFDRTQALLDGRVQVDGFEIEWTSGELESLFARAFANAEFDVTELSFCNYLIAAARGDCPYVALPPRTGFSEPYRIRDGNGACR